MADAKKCDRCGKDIGSVTSREIIDKHTFWSKRYDLCLDCYVEFKEWMKAAPEEPVWTGEGD